MRYSTVAQVDDSRSIKSQFQSWSAPCTTRERGTCVFRATGDVTVNAQFKSLTQTKFFFSGYGNWQLTVTAPTTIGLLATTPDATQTSVAAFGGAGSYAHCLGEAPGIRCLEVHTADNSTLSFDVFPIQGVPPVGTIGPLTFVGFSGGCSAATTPSPFATATCKMSSGTDQTATVKWQYYRCVSNSGASYANAGFAGHKLPPNEPTLTLNNCVLTQ
ncbi:MAG: hypothetical protein H7Z40_21290 [Phycisphaerae bacterium]|nr:hypothetical protein [Gemmatimonadaceae bacterium]